MKELFVTDENVEAMEDRFKAMSLDDPEFRLLGIALHRYMLGEPPSPPNRLRAAYYNFMTTDKGTPEHDKASDELVDAIFSGAERRNHTGRNC